MRAGALAAAVPRVEYGSSSGTVAMIAIDDELCGLTQKSKSID
eukprot:COSAG06_NODE_2046_length_7748_cov_7.658779_3_plen_43_part_00